MSKYKLVILDRDGVINEDSDEYIKSPAEWHAIPGSLEAIANLNRANIKVVIASNQSGIARGYLTPETLNEIDKKMHAELAKIDAHIDAVFYCPHHPDDNCECRKPKPGLLKTILEKYQISAKEAVVIGDSLRDIKAAQSMGCDAILVKTGKGEKTIKKHSDELKNIKIFSNLAAAITSINTGIED